MLMGRSGQKTMYATATWVTGERLETVASTVIDCIGTSQAWLTSVIARPDPPSRTTVPRSTA